MSLAKREAGVGSVGMSVMWVTQVGGYVRVLLKFGVTGVGCMAPFNFAMGKKSGIDRDVPRFSYFKCLSV